jgi:hypothetical protein
MKKSTIFRLSLIVAICGLFILQSCEEDPVTPPVDNSASVKPYVLVNGVNLFVHNHVPYMFLGQVAILN